MNVALERRKAAKELLALKPGEHLDHLVATEVMGWRYKTCGNDPLSTACCVRYYGPELPPESAATFNGRKYLRKYPGTSLSEFLWKPSTNVFDAELVATVAWPDEDRTWKSSEASLLLVRLDDDINRMTEEWCLNTCLLALAKARGLGKSP